MTALITAVFCGTALLAMASMVTTARHHAVAAIAILRQRESGCGQSMLQANPARRKHLVYARRVKPQTGWRARAKARRAGRTLCRDSEKTRRDSKHVAGPGMSTSKSVHSRNYGFRLALLQDRLAVE